jgi:2-aminoadipate transaminase
MSESELQKVQTALAQRWQGRSPKDFANEIAAPLLGSAGEWDLPADVTPKRDLLYLAVGMPDADSLPKQALAEAAEAILKKPGDLALRYGFGLGPEGIRSWLAERRSRLEQLPVDASWFQVTNGSSGAIDLVVRTLIDPGDVIISETPTYMGTLHNFRGVKADVRYVPVDDQGMDTTALAELLEALAGEGKRVKLIYTISAFQNPTGVTLPLERRIHLLALACQYDAIVLDDEAYRDLWFDEPPPRALSALAGGWGVISVGSFSKTVATGIRVGWVHAHPDLLGLFGRMRFSMGQNQFGLRAFGEFLARDEFDAHLERVRVVYRNKRDQLHQAMLDEGLDQYMHWQLPKGGFYFWARLRDDLDLRAVWRTAVEEGIAINSGAGFTPRSYADDAHIRIAFPWTPAADFPEAAKRLRLACQRVAAGDPA